MRQQVKRNQLFHNVFEYCSTVKTRLLSINLLFKAQMYLIYMRNNEFTNTFRSNICIVLTRQKIDMHESIKTPYSKIGLFKHDLKCTVTAFYKTLKKVN